MFPYKLCQIRSITYPTTKRAPGGYSKSLRHSSVIMTTASKGIVFCTKEEEGFFSKLKKLATLMFEPDKNFPSSQELEHEKILKEQQKELERLRNEPRFKDSDEKFPKYTPK